MAAVLLSTPIDFELLSPVFEVEQRTGQFAAIAQRLAVEPVVEPDPDLPGAGFALVGFHNPVEDTWAIGIAAFNLPVALKARELKRRCLPRDDNWYYIRRIQVKSAVYPMPSKVINWAAAWFAEQGIEQHDLPIGEWPDDLGPLRPVDFVSVGPWYDRLRTPPNQAAVDEALRKLAELEAELPPVP